MITGNIGKQKGGHILRQILVHNVHQKCKESKNFRPCSCKNLLCQGGEGGVCTPNRLQRNNNINVLKGEP